MRKRKRTRLETHTHGWTSEDADSLECLAWAMYDGVFMPGNKLALSGYYDWDHVVAGTLIRLDFSGAD